jgi:hypothetical protein
MRDHGHHVVFATPTGRTARADPKMVTGEGLGILSPLLKAGASGRSAYLYMEQSEAFRRPISYGEIRAVLERWLHRGRRAVLAAAGRCNANHDPALGAGFVCGSSGWPAHPPAADRSGLLVTGVDTRRRGDLFNFCLT